MLLSFEGDTPPDVRLTSTALVAFDARGRLWVTETRLYPYPAKPGEAKRDAIKVIELGPVNASIHKLNEHITLDELEMLPRIYLDTLRALLP